MPVNISHKIVNSRLSAEQSRKKTCLNVGVTVKNFPTFSALSALLKFKRLKLEL